MAERSVVQDSDYRKLPLTDVHAVLVEVVMAAGAHQEVFSFVQFIQADGTDIFRLFPITLVTVNLNRGLIRNSQLCELRVWWVYVQV